MYTIHKVTSHTTVDYAAEELKKYLRMMMPEGGDVKIAYAPDAADGFRLGLMQNFGLDVSDAEDCELDDILYIDCDTEGGIIAGDNPRSVLLAVYEYLRQNGCRWLMPGVDGEFIPMQDIVPVKYRFKPSCRYRGQCNEGAEFQSDMLEAIEFTPKVGMNVFMMEFKIPVGYYRNYYNHNQNQENRKPEPVSNNTVLQWKRQCEAEIAKRGLQFHDIGHGFTMDPFGVDSSWRASDGIDYNSVITPEQRSIMAEINGERKLYNKTPNWTNFCMSNAAARRRVAEYVAEYAENHSNVDYLHIWLADGTNNHCECAECQKKTPSDFYMLLMNAIDDALTAKNLDTRIVFIVYVDTKWAPLEESIKNPKRFTMLFAPIHRSYAYSMPDDGIEYKVRPYVRNKNVFPKNLAESFAYYNEWRKSWKGAAMSYEYHFWRHQCYDISGLETARRVNDDVKLYKLNDVNGVIQDGSQRSFFPNGFAFYSYARTLYDTSLSYDEILEDYFSAAYGADWKQFVDYLKKLYAHLPFEIFSRDEANHREYLYYSPEWAEKIGKIREITAEGRKLIEEHYNSDVRMHTVHVRLLEKHAEFCDLVSDFMAAKSLGKDELAEELYNKARITFGKYEAEIERYFDQSLYFSEYSNVVKKESRLPASVTNANI